MSTKAAVGRVRRKKEYNSKVKKLEQQVYQLTQLLQQEGQSRAAAHEEMTLLAEAIVQHKVMFALLHPLQHSAMQQAGTDSSSIRHQPWLAQVERKLQHNVETSSAKLLKLAAGSNLLLGPALKATAEHLKALAVMDEDGVRQWYLQSVNAVLMLTELLSPGRYPPTLLCRTKQGQQAPHVTDSGTDSTRAAAAAAGAAEAAAAAAGAPGAADAAGAGDAAAAADDELLSEDIEAAAAKLLSHLKSYKQLIDEVMRVSMLLTLHAAGPGSVMLHSMGDLNFQTGEREHPPASHYLQAVRRLRLTSRQVQQWQLMHKQFNRMARQHYLAGQQLVGLSNNSFSLLAAAAGSVSPGSSTLQHSGWSSDWPCSSAQQQAGRDTSPGALLGAAGRAGSSSSEPLSVGRVEAEEEGEDGPAAGALEELLAKHVRNHLDLLTVVQLWATSTLSPWQLGEFCVACLPYYPWSPALIELSAFLTPCDTRPVQINADCCEAAAEAAALAAELGFLDSHAYMDKRCKALEDQLKYLLAEGLDPGP